MKKGKPKVEGGKTYAKAEECRRGKITLRKRGRQKGVEGEKYAKE